MRLVRCLSIIVILAGAAALSGCETLSYYGHVFSGQMDVLSKRRPIPEVIEDPQTPPEVRRKLQAVQRMREFAVERMALPQSESFTSYADLERSYVLWSVYATPELSLETRSWCYPFLGCVDYRSYFDEARARDYAARLRDQGWDVYIAPSPAYSTAGWFDDPVYNTVLQYSEAEIAGILFHELAHERIYVPDATTFNESFAMTVQLEGARRWLASTGREARIERYLREQARNEEFVALLLEHRRRLQRLYASERSVEGKREAKARILEELQHAYANLKASWGGSSGYDWWFQGELNNATLAPIGTYHRYIPAFRALLKQHGGNLIRFYEAVDGLAELPHESRDARLEALGLEPVKGKPAR